MSVSIVMPVYNEEEVIEKVIRQYYAEIIAKIDGAMFIVINDGSTDSTAEILARLAKEFLKLKIITLQKNRGHGAALQAGLTQAETPLIFQVDSDNQFRAEDFWKLYQLKENSDIVFGRRAPRRDPWHRKVISLIAVMVNMAIFGVMLRDVNSPFKLIKAHVVKGVLKDIPAQPFAISMLITIAAKCKGYRVTEIPVAHFARATGRGKFASLPYLCKGCFWSLCDLLLLRRRLWRS